MPTRDLPARASLENLRKQSKSLHRGFQSGDADAVARIRANLPRINELAESDVADAELSRQEAQHVLAKEYGFHTWEAICQAASAGFDELGRLTDREAQVLLKAISQKDLTRSLVGAPEAVTEKFLSNMSQRVRTFLTQEGERYADLDEAEVGASRQRVVEWARTLGADDRISWPPPEDRDLKPPRRKPEPVDDPLEGQRLEEVSIEELANLLGSLDQEAKRNGILSIEAYAEVLPSVLGEALKLAVDGTQPGLIRDIVATRVETTTRNRGIRLRQMLQGVMSLQAGENPWIVYHKQTVFFVDAGAGVYPERHKEDIDAQQLAEWLRRGGPVRLMSFAQIAELFLHLAFLARREGITALAPVAAGTDEPILRDGLSMAAQRRSPEDVRAEMEPRIDEDLQALQARLQAASAGVLALVAGKDPEEVAAVVREAAVVSQP